LVARYRSRTTESGQSVQCFLRRRKKEGSGKFGGGVYETVSVKVVDSTIAPDVPVIVIW